MWVLIFIYFFHPLGFAIPAWVYDEQFSRNIQSVDCVASEPSMCLTLRTATKPTAFDSVSTAFSSVHTSFKFSTYCIQFST